MTDEKAVKAATDEEIASTIGHADEHCPVGSKHFCEDFGCSTVRGLVVRIKQDRRRLEAAEKLAEALGRIMIQYGDPLLVAESALARWRAAK